MSRVTISSQEFGQIFVNYRDKFVSIAKSYVRDEVVAEDIVAEAFTNFWDNRDSIDLQTIPEAYILQSVKNRCSNYLRDRATRVRIQQKMHDESYSAMLIDIDILSHNSMGFLFEDEVKTIFMDFMKTLPDMTRNIFFSSRFDDLTYQEIADKYNVTPRKVKRDIQNVLALMRKSLKDYMPIIVFLLPLLSLIFL